MPAYDAEIEDIVKMIWTTVLDIPLEVGGGDALGEDSTVTGVVQIEGAWNGAVLLQCPLALASTLTVAMFQTGDDPAFDDVRDALGELTNMVAGNLKSLLPGPSAISLPTVALGSNYEISVIGTKPSAAVTFTCLSLPLMVSLDERVGMRVNETDQVTP